MPRRVFKSKKITKKKQKIRLKYILYILGIYLMGTLTFNYLKNHEISISNKDIFSVLLSDTNHVIKKDFDSSKLINNFFKLFSNVDISKPVTALDDNIASTIIKVSSNDNDDYSNLGELEKVSKYIEDPNPEENLENPIVYIYNSHQLENYSANNLEVYNIKPNVMMTSYMLREELKKYGINSLVEETNITELLKVNGWGGSSAYRASKILIEDAIEKNKSIKYFIDVHRDSVSRNYTTTEINGKTYAKLYFVIGLENPNYKYNMEFAKKLDEMLNSTHKGISKGILAKEGPGVNGVYNQDINKNVLLIEFGGVDNTIEEVKNTTQVLAKKLSEYIKSDVDEA
ncbi:MAG: stage II sporulation protein P [Bacilli bacterium]|nr:stage II sporulation protein P [Bacilli bacterium]